MRDFEHLIRGKSFECPDTEEDIDYLRNQGYSVDSHSGDKPLITAMPRLYLDVRDRFQIADLLRELADHFEEDEPIVSEAYTMAYRFVDPLLLGHHQQLNDTANKRFTPEQIEFLIEQGVDPKLIDTLPRTEG